MKATIAAACLGGSFVLATSASAQAHNEAQTETGKKTITVAGCLREAPGTQGEFLLTKEPVSTVDTAGEANTYRVVGGGSVNLKDHVGQRVEVKGEIGGGPASTHEGQHPDEPTVEGAGEPKLAVMALKQISRTCEPLPSK